MEAQILSESLCPCSRAFLLGVRRLLKRPTVGLSVLLGATCGVLALVRSEQILLLLIVVAPLLYRARTLTLGKRTLRVVAMGVAAVVIILPWALYNTTRFDEPVVLSTNGGSTFLAGNSAPSTYRGELIGFRDTGAITGSGDKVTVAIAPCTTGSRDEALSNIRHNLGKLPLTVAARSGALRGIRPDSCHAGAGKAKNGRSGCGSCHSGCSRPSPPWARSLRSGGRAPAAITRTGNRDAAHRPRDFR